MNDQRSMSLETECAHVPDLHTVTIAETATQEDWIFDVNCKFCGRSGAFRVDSPEVDW